MLHLSFFIAARDFPLFWVSPNNWGLYKMEKLISVDLRLLKDNFYKKQKESVDMKFRMVLYLSFTDPALSSFMIFGKQRSKYF